MAHLAWSLALAALLAASSARAANVKGIINPADVAGAFGSIEDSGPRESCTVLIKPYPIWGSPANPKLAKEKAPTANPPPAVVYGAIGYELLNTGTSDILPPYNLTIYNANYTSIEQVWNFNETAFSNHTLDGFVNTPFGVLKANAASKYEAGFIVNSTTDAMTPTAFTVNDISCSVLLVNNITGPYLPFKGNTSSVQTESSEQPISYDSNGNFLDVNGNPITLNCANYFGFNNGATMFDGLYAGSSALTQDFATVLQRIKLLGVNCLRVPFSFQTLFNAAPGNKAVPCNPVSQDDVRNSVIPSGVNVPSYIATPALVYPENNNPSTCNGNLPNDSVYHRFLYMLQFLARNNFYVMIDDHSEDATVVNNPGAWPGLWASLVKDIVADTPSANRVFVDLLNEPDHAAFTWQTVGPLYLAAMDAIHSVAPNMLMAIEGTGQLGIPGINWGDGFATDPDVLRNYGCSDPTSFFWQLSGKPYLGNVVISPHVYPPSVSFATQGYQGDSLFYRLYESFGYLKTVGFNGHKFAVLVGETGSKFEKSVDLQSMADMSAWYQASGNTGQAHSAIQDICYWSWNANSGDTGGLVDLDTWTDVQWTKVNWMQGAMGLTPWYQTATGAAQASPPPPVSSPPPPSPPPPPPPRKASPPPKANASPPPKATPKSPPPKASPSPPPKPAPAKPAPAAQSTAAAKPLPSGFSCKASVVTTQPWGGPGAYYNTISVNVENTGSTQLVQPYTITVASSSYQTLAQYWNWAASLQPGGRIVGTVSGAAYQNLNKGNSVNVGFVIQQATNGNFAPSSVQVIGQSCSL